MKGTIEYHLHIAVSRLPKGWAKRNDPAKYMAENMIILRKQYALPKDVASISGLMANVYPFVTMNMVSIDGTKMP